MKVGVDMRRFYMKGLLIAVLTIFWNPSCVAEPMNRSGLSRKVYADGPGGKCELYLPKNNKGRQLANSDVRCKGGWIRNKTTTLPKITLIYKPKCQYYKKTVHQVCYADSTDQSPVVTCVKKIISYFIGSACSGEWLQWEECDRSCGGGFSTRIKLTPFGRVYRGEYEIRPCNTHRCPEWSEWEPLNYSRQGNACDPNICTRIWERNCIYNNAVSNPNLCAEKTGSKVYSLSPDLTNSTEISNLTHESHPCDPTECEKQATTFMDVGIIAPVRSANGVDILVGIGIGVALVLVILSISYCVMRMTGRSLNTDKICTWTFRRPVLRLRSNDPISYTGAIPRAQNGAEYMQPTLQRTATALPIPPPPLEGTFSSTNGEGTYCSVPLPRRGSSAVCGHLSDQQTQMQQDFSEFQACRLPQSSSVQQSDSTHDPVYSDIPAYQVDRNQRSVPGYPVSSTPNGYVSYSSSEFASPTESSNAEESGNQTESSIHSNNAQETQAFSLIGNLEDGCRSFDSDEGRDVVNTLRKTARKQRSKRTRGKASGDEANLSDGDMPQEEYIKERRSAYSVRYSKIHAKRRASRGSRSHTFSHSHVDQPKRHRRGEEDTCKDFLVSDSSSNCVPSMHKGFMNKRFNARSVNDSSSHPRLACRLSSGASSVNSFHMDAATSGYNSAFGDSTDEDSIPFNRWIPDQHRFSSRSLQHGDNVSRRRDNMSERLPMPLPNAAPADTRGRPRRKSSASLFNSKIAHTTLPSFSRTNSVRQQNVQPENKFHNFAPGLSRESLPCAGTCEPDISKRCRNHSPATDGGYDEPIDAKPEKVEETIYSLYNVPYDALPTGQNEDTKV